MKLRIQKISIIPFIFLIKIYQQAISPFLGNNCRFQPSCSQYVKEALEKYGLIKGIGLGILRMGKCHPWGGKGYDPLK